MMHPSTVPPGIAIVMHQDVRCHLMDKPIRCIIQLEICMVHSVAFLSSLKSKSNRFLHLIVMWYDVENVQSNFFGQYDYAAATRYHTLI